MLSIYSSWFNVERTGFPWRETLRNWMWFLGGTDEIVIVVNTSEDDSARLIRDFAAKNTRRHAGGSPVVKVVEAAVPYTDPEFDGKLKALALSHCTQPYCILLDCDEAVHPESRRNWLRLVQQLEQNKSIDSFMVPVVDIFGEDRRYRCDGGSLGTKWYIHRNSPNITRGVVKWARRENGTVDITKSDTCELVYKDSGELVSSSISLMPAPHFIQIAQLASGEMPFVYHLGYLDLNQRIKQDTFWAPVWQARDGSEVKTVKTLEELKKARTYPHNLPDWRVRE